MAFVELFGDKLHSKDGEISTAETLNGKVVGVYFSAHWCPPCRSFTPELAKCYDLLTGSQGKNFEIVFVSSDNDEAGFNEYYAEMPWKALPYSERERKKTLSSKYRVNGIPSFIILNESGAVITKEGRNMVDDDPTGEKFPWVPPQVQDIIGTEFQSKDGSLVSLADLQGKHIAVYFSAHWCPPCRTFTPKLIETYKKMKAKGVEFEIIFASSDKEQKQFDEYYAEMPWLAIPYSDRARKQALSQKFGVTGIPALVIMDKEMKVINPNARLRVSNDPDGADFPWGPKAVVDLDEDPSNINDYPSVWFIKNNISEEAGAAVVRKLEELGQEAIDEAQKKDEEQEMMFFTSQSSSGKISTQLLGAMDLSTEKLEKPLLVLVDIPASGQFYLKECDVPTPEVVNELIKEYKDKTLNMSQLQ